MSSNLKHSLHCICLVLFIIVCFKLNPRRDDEKFFHGRTFLLIFLNILSICSLPFMLSALCGLLFFNAWPDKVQLKEDVSLLQFICFRVVTRGDYPELVKHNVQQNIETCLGVGLKNFEVEVVTEKTINLDKNPRSRETVVPREYNTRNGTLFKARNLQYCLEEHVNTLKPHDWIVHLDEDTVLTENSVRGIVNFVTDGKHEFGQGLVTHINDNVVNWITTLADCFNNSFLSGVVQFQFKAFHKPIFGWLGSFTVAKVKFISLFFLHLSPIYFG
jgi:beta-1,4-mannosyltransferase